MALCNSVSSLITATELARRLGLTKAAVCQWQRVPAERVLEVCDALDWAVSPHDVRPDIYPNATDALPAGASA